MRCGLDAWIATGAGLHVPTWSCLLAEAELTIGAVDNALQVILRARQAAERTGEIFMTPEIDRLHARCLLDKGRDDEAALMLDRSVQTAGEFEAHWLALRAACDLSALHARSGESASGLVILDDVLRHCHEGEDCADLQKARALRDRRGLQVSC